LDIQPLTWEQVESSNVDKICFHEQTHTICVKFRSGGLYSYSLADNNPYAPSEIYTSFRMAPSVGRYLNLVIKAFPFLKWDSEIDLISHLVNQSKQGTTSNGYQVEDRTIRRHA
jgi:hypothetical protein